MTHNYKLTIAYDGTHYHGWQVQPNGLSIQEKLQTILPIFLRQPVQLTGSGRTDAGVHAYGQVAHFHLDQEIDLFRFLGAANSLLPHDIRILSIEPVAESFHARYSAVAKTYHYHLCLNPVQDPFRRLYSLHLHEKIDREKLFSAASQFLGTHDFAAFANSAHQGVAAHDSIRTVQRLDLIDVPGGLRLEIEADGFLYKMVRNIVGMLLDIASGKRDESDISQTLASKDRRTAGRAAPPHGLFLMEVKY
jgi:tRNA pseudouridine38-40 synthase